MKIAPAAAPPPPPVATKPLPVPLPVNVTAVALGVLRATAIPSEKVDVPVQVNDAKVVAALAPAMSRPLSPPAPTGGRLTPALATTAPVQSISLVPTNVSPSAGEPRRRGCVGTRRLDQRREACLRREGCIADAATASFTCAGTSCSPRDAGRTQHPQRDRGLHRLEQRGKRGYVRPQSRRRRWTSRCR